MTKSSTAKAQCCSRWARTTFPTRRGNCARSSPGCGAGPARKRSSWAANSGSPPNGPITKASTGIYRYVLVDSNYLEPAGEMRWEEIRYRPHLARFEGEEITVVVRDRELSDAQQSGMDAGWFMNEVHERTKNCDFPPLVM